MLHCRALVFVDVDNESVWDGGAKAECGVLFGQFGSVCGVREEVYARVRY